MFSSHAAVVARGWGKPCICGCGDLKIDTAAKTMVIKAPKGRTGKRDITVREGDWISINGDTGEVFVGKMPLKPPAIYEDGSGKSNSESSDAGTNNVVTFMRWVDAKRKLEVMANADTPADALEARRNGAQGIGLTRTEHMFFRFVKFCGTSGVHRELLMMICPAVMSALTWSAK
jgi:pyruvate,orthophosphate dikinase